MGCIGNILWLISGGLVSGLSWFFVGLLWCITIVGIPVGVQCFKLGGLSFMPFCRNVEYGGGAVSLIMNIIWLLFGGLELALEFCIFGILLSITIIGIPFGIQFFKLARLALFPFGAQVD
ncbi:MAG: YccF domain-containing protein [Ruminococcus sp.]|nr:YccF domain-containing protein [Ruminococcus sp.]